MPVEVGSMPSDVTSELELRSHLHGEATSDDITIDMNQSEASHPPADPSRSGLGGLTALVMPHMSKFGVFIAVILLKLLYSHRLGLLVIVALSATWYHANNLLTQQISLRGHARHKQFVSKLLWCITFLSINIVCVYRFLDHGDLSRRLIFGYSDLELVDLWALLWIVLLNDYMVKFGTIILKAVIALIPATVMSYDRKGSSYAAIELVSALYRSTLPIIPWYCFLLGDQDGLLFSAILFVIYIVFKFLSIYTQLAPLLNAFRRLFKTTTYGVSPSAGELAAVGENCSVCHDIFSGPILLPCKHIFCGDCISVWFDKERTCPMCRAQVHTDDPIFRDGSGMYQIQFF